MLTQDVVDVKSMRGKGCKMSEPKRALWPLIQEALADWRTAKARNAVCRADLALELVVVRKFVV
jgi:hypothetical protein